MSYKDIQLQVLITICENKLESREVVVGYFNNELKKIYFTTRYKKWPPIVNLIQGVGSRHFNTDNIFSVAFCPPVSIMDDGMTRGMIDFLNSFEGTINCLPVARPTETPEFKEVAATRFFDDCQFIHLEPADVAERAALDSVIVTSTGEPPNADLNDQSEAPYYHRLYMALAYNRAGFRGMFRSPYTEMGHNISAIFATDAGQVLAISYNKKNFNDTFHAEVNLVQAIVKKFPNNDFHQKVFFIYTTLKPCKMCAAMIATVFPNARVVYGQNDPGRHAQQTLTPVGGSVRSLAEVGKPLYAYDDLRFHQPDSKKGEIAGLLSPGVGTPITHGLNTIGSAKNMLRAGLSIDRKLKKYDEGRAVAKPAHPKIHAILRHLQPLMTNW
ncbi:Bd3614 family nucleic acid deaminase [Paraburkholderia sp. BR10872]|uniref:Bd3614 family nucleic acid deaminase n=1 Tax=Paraburkholderia sp. BR10872 TaxID=3236989 RepID=UPI0034D1D398